MLRCSPRKCISRPSSHRAPDRERFTRSQIRCGPLLPAACCCLLLRPDVIAIPSSLLYLTGELRATMPQAEGGGAPWTPSTRLSISTTSDTVYPVEPSGGFISKPPTNGNDLIDSRRSEQSYHTNDLHALAVASLTTAQQEGTSLTIILSSLYHHYTIRATCILDGVV